MKQRLISAAFMIVIGVPLLVWGGLPSKLFLYAVSIIVDYELTKTFGKFNIAVFISMMLFQFSYYITGTLNYLSLFIVVIFIIGIYNANFKADSIGCCVLLTLTCSLAVKTAIDCFSVHRLLFFTVCASSLICDAGAYFIGRKYGKNKLCERISPKKTIEGAIGGVVVSFVVVSIFMIFIDFFGINPLLAIVLALIFPILSEFGDLSFSLIKRHFNIKDFSNIIPGHGGLLDRFDSIIICLLVLRFVFDLIL